MDDKNLEELKEEATIDNSRLEELMKREITPEMQEEFFEVLKNSRLMMPVTYSASIFEGIENAKEGDVFEAEESGFNINYLTDHDGNRAIPLFTSEDAMKEAGLTSSTIVLYMSDLADLVKQTDKYSIIAINPFTSHDLNMPVGAFLSIFEEPSDAVKAFTKLLDIIKEHSVELEENTTLFLRSDENLMIENAVDGVFKVKAPLYVSSNPKQGEDLKYTNILLMPAGKRILPIGPDNEFDIIIAPGTEFRHEDTMDGTTNLWMCLSQPFFDE